MCGSNSGQWSVMFFVFTPLNQRFRLISAQWSQKTVKKPKTGRRPPLWQRDRSVDDKSLNPLLVDFPYGDVSFPALDVIHVDPVVAGHRRHSASHVSWNVGEASRTEAGV